MRFAPQIIPASGASILHGRKPGALGSSTLRRTEKVRLRSDSRGAAGWLPGGTTISTISRRRLVHNAGYSPETGVNRGRRAHLGMLFAKKTCSLGDRNSTSSPRFSFMRDFMKRYYLAIEKGSLRTSMHPLVAPTTIGRGPDNSIIIEETTASRSHASVSFLEGAWTVEDLGSTNGVFVAGKRITKAALGHGDTFHIGVDTFRLVEMEVSGDRTHLSDTV